jgi:NADPH:quinone reductase-like Zn-dependent oxidoreductase
VSATASAANIDFVKQLGADDVINYRERRLKKQEGLTSSLTPSAGRLWKDHGTSLGQTADSLRSQLMLNQAVIRE